MKVVETFQSNKTTLILLIIIFALAGNTVFVSLDASASMEEVIKLNVEIQTLNDDKKLSLQKIENLTRVVNQAINGLKTKQAEIEVLDQRLAELSDIDALERRITNVEERVGMISTTVQAVDERLVQSSEKLDTMIQKVDHLDVQINNISLETGQLSGRMTNIETQLEKNKAFSISKRALATPGKVIADSIIDKVTENLDIDDVFRAAAKLVIAPIINSKIPELVWHDDSAEKISTNTFRTTLKTYFGIRVGVPILGDISISRIEVTALAEVNISTGEVANMSILSVRFLAIT